MTDPEVLELAQWLWENQENRVHPDWDQLGGVTQGVWIGYAQDRLFGDLA